MPILLDCEYLFDESSLTLQKYKKISTCDDLQHNDAIYSISIADNSLFYVNNNKKIISHHIPLKKNIFSDIFAENINEDIKNASNITLIYGDSYDTIFAKSSYNYKNIIIFGSEF